MDLNLYDVIIRPRATTKVQRLNQKEQQVVLEVHPKANKPLIKQALKLIFNLDVTDVRTLIVKGKQRKVGRHVFQDKLRKKAIITFKAGQMSELATLSSGTQMPEASSSVTA